MSRWSASSYGQIFNIAPFRLFWLGFTLSGLGDMMTRVALTWYVYDATGSAEALGLLMLFYTGPVIFGGFLAGWLLDRFDRRMVMLLDNLLRGAAVATVPVLHAAGVLALWHIYVVAAAYGTLMMVSLAGGPSLIPSLVPARHLATANALETLTFTLSGVLGPMVAGLLIGLVGAPNLLILDALSYMAFALALTGSKVPPAADVERAHRAGPTAYSLWQVVRFSIGSRVLLSTTLMFAAFNLGQGMLFVWLPVLSSALGGGADLYGILLGVWAAGEVAGSLVAGSARPRLPLGTLICVSQLLSGLSLGLLLLHQSLLLAVPALALIGAFSAPLTIWAQTLRMQIIPERMRGRAFALLRTLMQSTPPLGGALAGLLLPMLGIPVMIGITALLAGAPGLLGYAVRDLRTAGCSGQTEQETAETVAGAELHYVVGE